jgi:hypothetical protein
VRELDGGVVARERSIEAVGDEDRPELRRRFERGERRHGTPRSLADHHLAPGTDGLRRRDRLLELAEDAATGGAREACNDLHGANVAARARCARFPR